MKKLLLTAIIASSVFVSGNSFAYRPFRTEDASVGPVGEIGIEGGWEHVRERDDTEHALFMAFILGLGRAEISVEGPYRWMKYPDEERDPALEREENGMGDLTVFGKVRLLGSSNATGMFSLKAEAKTTTGDEEKGLGSGIWQYAGSLVLSKQFASFIIHAQGGYAYVDDPDERSFFFYGLALDWELTRPFSISAECVGSYNSDEKPVSAGGGFIIQIIHEVVLLDALCRRGLTDDADDWYFTAGMTLIR